ncbi:ferredoxin [Thomasclavelia cocleata]|jgi:ferredoxin|uniref:Ferredoxin n=1 Tax=Thomasclavelia cocleata TaxID=69824 RepID=A0A1I0HBY6_9FIRM|nr:ferredoxin [Thomasclavelia cocleata]MCI9132205.1 ferredoxin [Thomasclavelia cocleata]MCI9631172.1 ferredoxin [Thomasclavelia cocleata]MCR1959704.1 ferredoxin [Thomasclavelia cocleata]NDO41103.1 ferredoxin [Thomasclavelia cocleata]SET81236.1 ferredoxin [Thomasclavelia cocleata]
MAKITVNESCIGCGACTAVAPDVFEIGDDGLAVVVSEENIDGAKEAAESCPVEAIEVE